MCFYKQLSLLFITSFTLFFSEISYCQSEDVSGEKKDTTEAVFEKIMLDGKVSYLNIKTSEFLSKSEYFLLLNSDTSGRFKQYRSDFDYFNDHWVSDRVNPYRDVVLSTPFKVDFDQSTFSHPIDGDIRVTSRFGKRRRRPHRGIDLDLVTGDTVRTVLAGKVRFVGYSRGHGKTVVVRHVNEVETVYAHLSEYAVEVNDVVAEGQLIGYGGNTGRSTGSHLHLEVRYKGVCIHPEYIFNFDGSQTIRGTELWVTNNWKSTRAHSAYRKSKINTILSKADAIAAQNAEPKFHKVRRGDTLSHIARTYHLGVSEICQLNSISKNSTLRIGQIVKVK